MNYMLEDRVYIVNGIHNACIYNLNDCRLYKIDKMSYEWLVKMFEEKEEKKLSNEEKQYFENLESLHLIKKGMQKQERVELEINQHISFAWIEVTTRCNLKCKHCYEEASCNNYIEMKIENFSMVINQLFDIGVKRIQLIGGEPLIIGDKFETMIEMAYNKFEQIEVFTNGTMIDQHWIEVFRKYNIKIALSVYSYDKNEHDKVTGYPGSCEKTNNAIRMLKNAGISYRVCNVLMKDIGLGNQNTDLYTLSPKYDVVRLTGRADLRLLDRRLIRKKLIVENTFSKPISKKYFYRAIGGHNCFATKIYVGADLTVYPCVMERRFSHGSLIDNDLKNILKKDIMEFSKDKIKVCQKCEYRYACFDCRPNSLGDDIYAKPWYCTYDPETGIWADPEQFIDILFQ